MIESTSQRRLDHDMTDLRFISSDTHVIEPPDLWTDRLGPKFRSRAPHVVEEEDADRWYVDGKRFLSFSGGTQTGMRFDTPERLVNVARFRDVRPGAYLPDEHLRENA